MAIGASHSSGRICAANSGRAAGCQSFMLMVPQLLRGQPGCSGEGNRAKALQARELRTLFMLHVVF